MLTIHRDNREEIETEYIALLVNKPELIEINQIKPQYLFLEENKNMLISIEKAWKKYHILNAQSLLANKEFNQDYYIKLLTEVFFYKNAYKEQLKLSEESILKYYKEDIIANLNNDLKNKKMSYGEFVKKIKKLDEINPIQEASELTEEEMLSVLDEQKTSINLKKFSNLNTQLKLVQNDFLIVGATTGAGKSGLLLNFMDDLMDDYQCIYFNMEMSKSTIYKRLVSIRAEMKIMDVETPNRGQVKIIEDTIKKIASNKVVIEHKANDIKEIKSILAKVKDKSRHTILFIDHIGLTRCEDKKSLYEQATEVAKQLRQICLEYDCTIISASQLNRGAYQTEELTLSMLKDSGELENSASKVILLYPEAGEDTSKPVINMMLKIAKNRDGMLGTIKTIYDKTKQTFKEI
jgi:replicative DNA helicase